MKYFSRCIDWALDNHIARVVVSTLIIIGIIMVLVFWIFALIPLLLLLAALIIFIMLISKKKQSFDKRIVRCKNGHKLPENSAFEHYGAVFQGGICPVCGLLVQGIFLGNAWSEEEEKKITVPDFDSAEGKAALSECLDGILRGGERDAMIVFEKFRRKSEELPKKTEVIIAINGLDFSKFEKDGWVIARLPV